MKLSIGIDIGASFIRFGLVDAEGKLHASEKEAVTAQRTAAALVNQIADGIKRLPCDGADIIGVGIGIPGPVRPASGYVYVLPNLQIPAFDVARAVAEKTGYRVVVNNDGNAAALGEALVGAGKGFDLVQYVTLSTGIGGGLVLHGKIYQGHSGFAQEIGNMIIHPHGPKPNPAMNAGAWESYCSGTALVRAVGAWGHVVHHAGEVFSDPQYAEIIDAWIDDMAIAIANMVTLYEPDIFVFGGGVMKSQAYFWDALVKKVDEYVFNELKGKIRLVPALLGQDAGLIGAGLLAFAN